MRILGLVMCFALMLWIMNMAAGIAAFIDLISLSVIFGGGIAYAIAKGGVSQSRDQAFLNFADGAVYWGWLGFLVGCVGIAGTQTAIYPSCTPGGWQIIGRTPQKMVDWDSDSLALVQVGDQVRFRAISRDEFLELGGNLDEL